MTQLDDLKQQAEAVNCKIFYLLFCKYFLALGTVSGFVAGMYFLIANVIAFDNKLPGILLCAALLVGTVLAAYFTALKHKPSDDRVITLLDRVNKSGGMLLSATELIECGWNPRELVPEEVPEIRLRSYKTLITFSAALIFAFTAWLIPPAVKAASGNTRMDIKNETGELAEQLQVLEEEKIVSEKEAENLREQMGKLEKSAAGEDPVKTWEALDHMRESFKNKAEEFAEKAARQAEALTLSEEALRALQEAREKAGTQDYDQAAAEMSELMRRLAESCPKLSEKLSQELKDMLKEGKLSKEAMEELLKAQQLTQEQLEALLEKLKQCGLCDKGGSCSSSKSGKTTMVTRENFEKLMKLLDEASKGKGPPGNVQPPVSWRCAAKAALTAAAGMRL
jgi:hypothetical protein